MTTLEGPPLTSAEAVGALTLGGFLVEVGERFSEREALVFDDPLAGDETVRWTYAELLAQARRVAGALVAAGVTRGSRVGILMGNRPEAVASLFGAALAGATAVPLSTFSPAAELEYLLNHSGAGVLLTQVSMRGRRFAEDVMSLRPGSGRLPYLREVVAVGSPDWATFLAHSADVDPSVVAARAEFVRPSDEGLIIYSSGTTDHPKGVRHTHRAPALQFWFEARVFRRAPDTRLWTSLPMFWTAGLNTAMGPTLAAGGCWVMQESFEPGAALRLMARERVTEPYTLPHQTAALEEHEDWASADLSSLKCVFGKSAFARHPSVHGDTTWNMPVAYGMSETCTAFVTHYWDTPRDQLKASSGRLMAGNRLRVVDPDTGATLGAGEVGEFAIAGPTVMEGYVGVDRELTFDDEGFFHTGDVGFFDDDGFVHWTGRRSEMIKTGGASVSPAEIEVALRACPPVKLARVIGLPDDRMGQVVVLCAVLKEGAEAEPADIQSFLRGRLASYKVPKHVIVFDDGTIPMTGSDTKVRDAELTRLALARLSENSPSLDTGAKH